MDDPKVQGNAEPQQTPAPAERKQPEPMPSSNETSTEESKQLPAQEEELSLPEDASERTKEQFEKLKAQLAAEKAKNRPERSEFGESVFDTFKPKQPAQPVVNQQPYLNQQQTEQIASQFVDAAGNVDIQGLNQALLRANEVAKQAVETANAARQDFTRYEESRQVREAHAVHPELDPKSESFDPNYFDLVRDRLLRNMYQGKQQTLLEVAEELSKYYKPQASSQAQVKEQAVAEYKQAQAKREQGPVEAGRGAPRNASDSTDELVKRSRQPGKVGEDAIIERLRRATS